MTTYRDDESPSSYPTRNKSADLPMATTRASERVTNAELLEALGVAVYMTDARGVITDYNEAAVELWGRRPEIGKDEWCGSWRLYWPDGTPMPHGECPMAVTLKENRVVRGADAIAERPDGTRVCFVPYPTPLRNEAGQLIGAVNVLVDITARKAAEQALQDNERRLTDALAAKDEFLGLISHELRTPITVIVGNARVLTRPTIQLGVEDREAALVDIAHESERLHTIIDDLLVLAQADAREQSAFEPINVGRVISECVTEFARKYPARTFTMSGMETDLVAAADLTYVRQIATNLLSNAIKYSPPDSTVEIEVVADGDVVSVHVRDRGPGIAEDEREKVFETFYRSPATAKVASGIGAGLAVCRRLVTAMGGAIWATSRDGGGADIGFSLPAMSMSDVA